MKNWKFTDSSRTAVWFPGPPVEYRLMIDDVIQQWIAAGNVPEPPDPPPPPVEPRPSIEDRLEAVELIVDLGLMEGLL